MLASNFIGMCFDQAKPLLDKDSIAVNPYVRFVSTQLFINCHLTSESVLILIQEDKVWDADILIRSVAEGSFKYVYMLMGDEEEIIEKVKEYWDILPLFSDIKHSNIAKDVLEAVQDPVDPHWNPFRELIRDDNTVEQIRKNYSRTQRNKLNEKWSFAGISRYFSNSKDERLKHLANLVHGYGMSSHSLHKDAIGVGVVWERFQREPERQNAAKIGHSARVVSDVCAFAKLRLFFLLKLCKKELTSIGEIEKQYEALFSELSKAGSYFTDVEYGHQHQ